MVQITGSPIQTTALTTGKLHISLQGPTRPIGQGNPASGTTNTFVTLAADFTALFGMDSTQQTFNVPMRLDASLNTTTGQVSGSIHGQLRSGLPLLGGSTITFSINAAPLPRAAVVPDSGLTNFGAYSRSSSKGHVNRVDMSNGVLNVDPIDLLLPVPGRGLSVVLERYYSSHGSYGWFGFGWSTFLDTSLQYCPGCAIGGSDLFRYRDASGATFSIPYDSFAGCKNCRAPGLSATLMNFGTLAYDNGVVLQFELPPGAADSTYARRLIAIQDRNGNKISIKWDMKGHPVEIDDPLNRATILTSNASGSITLVTPPAPLAPVSYTYDGEGGPGSRLLTVTRSNVITRYEYGNYGDGPVLTSITDPDGYKTIFTYLQYDSKLPQCGNTVATVGYAKDATNTAIDTYAYTSCPFDSKGNPVGQSTVTDPNGHTTTYSWVPDDSTPMPDITITDAVGGRQTMSYDESTFKVSSLGNGLKTESYDYDSQGRMNSSTATGGITPLKTGYYYNNSSCLDNRSRLDLGCYLNSFFPLAITDPGGYTTYYGYDTNGNLHTATNALDQVTTINHNTDGTINSVQRPKGTTTTIAYHYDGAGGVTLATTDPLQRTSYSTFDAVGRLQVARTAAGDVTQYTHDQLGRLTDIFRGQSGSELILVYDPNGNVVRATAKG